jgi:hypothetical protein
MERPQPAVAAAEDAIELYDTYWFHRLVLHSYSPAPAPLPPTPPPPALEQQQQPGQAPAESNRELQRAPTGLRHRRTRSDEAKTADTGRVVGERMRGWRRRPVSGKTRRGGGADEEAGAAAEPLQRICNTDARTV